MKFFITILFLLGSFHFLFSQKTVNPANPVFDTFKGTAYELPRKKFNFKYHPKYEKQIPIAEFEWKEINIPETSTKHPFPDVDKKYGFAIIFKSQMTIKYKGWYKFSLNSDDGSVMWIDKKAAVLNDGTHQMRFQQDSIALEPGVYPIKIWYCQSFPDRYGIEFKSKFYRRLKPEETITPLLPAISKNLKMIIPNQILNFEHNKFQVDASAQVFLDSICNKILTFENISTIKISGHTDNVGNEKYNAELSIKRAATIREEFMKRIKLNHIKYEVKGYGESKPIDNNNTLEGKAKNRRVEIEIIQKKS